MSRWRDTAFQADLNRLLRAARNGRGQLPPQVEGSHEIRHDIDFEFRSIAGATYLLDADALALRRALRRRLAGSSRRDLGMSGDEAGVLLADACDEAVTGTIKGAIANLMAVVEAPIKSWVVAQSVAVHLPRESVRVGHATYMRRIPHSVARRAALDRVRERAVFDSPIAYITVQARGWQTARVLAAEWLADAASIVDLVARPNIGRVGAPMLIRAKGEGERYVPDPAAEIHPNYVDSGGRLVPPYRQLSRAAARDEDARSDWERRVLAATRWLSRGQQSRWPADRLAGVMVALECLFIAGERTHKGKHIAQRLTDRFKVNELTADEQRDWLEQLYSARNAAVHEGRDFMDDLQVDRLGELTRYVVRELSWHLVAGHRRAGRSCRTWEQAMACSAP
jgi:hypothetical protein